MCTKANKAPLGETYVDLAIYLIHKLHVGEKYLSRPGMPFFMFMLCELTIERNK